MEKVLSAFKPGTQNHRILTRLCFGPVDNGELIFKMKVGKYTGRISEVRRKLVPLGYDIEARRITNSHWKYYLKQL